MTSDTPTPSPSHSSSGSKSSWVLVQVFLHWSRTKIYFFFNLKFPIWEILGRVFWGNVPNPSIPFYYLLVVKSSAPSSPWICEESSDFWDSCEEMGPWECLQTSLCGTWVSERTRTLWFPPRLLRAQEAGVMGHRRQSTNLHDASQWTWGFLLHVNINAATHLVLTNYKHFGVYYLLLPRDNQWDWWSANQEIEAPRG